jgi:hypothetical protein
MSQPLVFEKDREILARLAALPMAQRVSLSVDAMPLPVRILNACQRLGLRSIAEVATTRRLDWYVMRNVGRKSVATLEEQLQLIDLELGIDPERLQAWIDGQAAQPPSITTQALRLPRRQRAELAQALLASLVED